MVDAAAAERGATGAWGWRILVVISALFALNGVGWYFAGPDSQVENIAEGIGITAAEFETSYPDAAAQVRTEVRLTAIYYLALGSMGSLAALAGHRTDSEWPWRITWVTVALPAVILVHGLAQGSGLGGFTGMMLVLASGALAGQLLAGRSLP